MVVGLVVYLLLLLLGYLFIRGASELERKSCNCVTSVAVNDPQRSLPAGADRGVIDACR